MVEAFDEAVRKGAWELPPAAAPWPTQARVHSTHACLRPEWKQAKKTWTNVTMTNSPPKNQDSADQAGPIHVRTAWHAWHAAKSQAGVGVWGKKLRHCPMRQHVRPHPLNRPPAARDGNVCRGGELSGTAAVTCFTVFFTSCNSPFGGRLLTLRMCGTMHGACACCTRTKKGSFSS